MEAGIGNAPISHRLQRRANLSQLPSRSLGKWSYRQDLRPQPLDYRSSALLLSYGRLKKLSGLAEAERIELPRPKGSITVFKTDKHASLAHLLFLKLAPGHGLAP